MASAAAVSDLRSSCKPPVIERHCGALPLILPSSGLVSTVILHDVAALSPVEQQMLSDWLGNGNGTTQVITTSAAPLFPLVKSGAFLATLYYRLNVIYVKATASVAAMTASSASR